MYAAVKGSLSRESKASKVDLGPRKIAKADNHNNEPNVKLVANFAGVSKIRGKNTNTAAKYRDMLPHPNTKKI